MIRGHGGDIYTLADRLGCTPADIIDMSSNINPLGMPPGLLDALKSHVESVGVLPEVDGRTIVERMAGLLAVDPGRMLAGNGTTQFIYMSCPTLNPEKVLIVGPTYADYGDACRVYAIEPDYFLLDPAGQFEMDWERFYRQVKGYDTVFICNPNNPTAGLIPIEQLQELCRSHPQTRFIIDESYLPFVPLRHAASMTGCGLENVVVLWSASKIFGIPGLRVGFLIAPEHTRARYERSMQPWCVNSQAQAAIAHLGRHAAETEAFILQTRQYLEKERHLFKQRLASCRELTLYPSVTSYILMRLPPSLDAQTVCEQLARRRLLIRNCSNFHGLSNRFVRVALKSSAVNELAAEQLAAVFANIDRS